jgi:hypothetical protein
MDIAVVIADVDRRNLLDLVLLDASCVFQQKNFCEFRPYGLLHRGATLLIPNVWKEFTTFFFKSKGALDLNQHERCGNLRSCKRMFSSACMCTEGLQDPECTTLL